MSTTPDPGIGWHPESDRVTAYRITFKGDGLHVVEFTPSGFDNFESATCKTCSKFLCCGFPPTYTHHAAKNHAGVCECKPSLVTWT